MRLLARVVFAPKYRPINELTKPSSAAVSAGRCGAAGRETVKMGLLEACGNRTIGEIATILARSSHGRTIHSFSPLPHAKRRGRGVGGEGDCEQMKSKGQHEQGRSRRTRRHLRNPDAIAFARTNVSEPMSLHKPCAKSFAIEGAEPRSVVASIPSRHTHRGVAAVLVVPQLDLGPNQADQLRMRGCICLWPVLFVTSLRSVDQILSNSLGFRQHFCQRIIELVLLFSVAPRRHAGVVVLLQNRPCLLAGQAEMAEQAASHFERLIMPGFPSNCWRLFPHP